MTLRADVCVIGSGAVGKACALALAQSGLQVALLAPAAAEPATDWPAHWDMRVYALNHVTQGLLSSLKVWQAMDAARIAPVDAMAVQGDAGERAGKLSFDAYGARVGALAWIVEEANLAQALENALRFAQGVHRVSGSAVALVRDADEAQVVTEAGEVIRCALVVGADGAHSWVRTQADIGLDYRSYEQRAVVANFACEHAHHGIASQWFLGADGVVALLPLPGQQVSLVWSAPESLATTLLREPAARLAQRLEALPGMTLGALSMLPPASPRAFPLRLISARSTIGHRVALIGDAAHVVHPLAGQGMNLGFADVEALVSAVTAAPAGSTDIGDLRALNRYARARREQVLLMQVATDGLHRLFETDLPPLRALRNAGMDLVNKLPFLKRRLVAQALGRPTASLPE